VPAQKSQPAATTALTGQRVVAQPTATSASA